ncbi:MAG: toxin [Gammaproteobacteria bacterium]|jgi:hypothetical protein|nr:toxin [Gammaproteobacteria bacterium]
MNIGYPIYDFSVDKNRQLIEQRNISFEQIIAAIEEGHLLDAVNHPNQEKYPGQEVFIVWVSGYVYMVPFVRKSQKELFLKTIIPSRKARKRYKKED